MTTRIFHGLPAERLEQPCYLAIGNFDGVHRGHQALIDAMLSSAHANGCMAGIMTFDPHPLAVLRPEVQLAHLTTMDERVDLLAAHGLDFVVVLPFTRDLAATSAADFVTMLAQRLQLRSLWVGPDFALGRGREGTIPRLAELGRELGYEVTTVEPFHVQGTAVHSSEIRELLQSHGAAAEAAELLGRPYTLLGEVTRGAGRGHDLGFPTANLAVPPERVIPAFGIYACWAWLGSEGAEGHPAAVSIGVRPTFDNGNPSVEAYLLDYQGDLYGQPMGLSFVERLRAEQRFPSAAALIAQMTADVAAARRILSAPPDDTGDSGSEPPASPLWEELPHTADWAIRVRGATQGQLFARSARAMFALMDADPGKAVTIARRVSVAGGNVSELLVSWLSRLLLEQELHGEMYTRFHLTDLSSTGLRGTAFGYRGSPEHTSIKAVTYWGLDVREGAGEWQASITFDV